ncbi:hypothetical protein [Streptacidiphilus monticola]|uniref:Lsr2 protein n=1 Tax=Streptacidiphilus monticola TaxID=2161674 RepID=A0ABW1GBZ3_9ACTN
MSPKSSPSLRERAEAAARFLDQAGEPAHAETVRELAERAAGRRGTPALVTYVYEDTWRQVLADPTPTTELIEQGYAALLAGTWRPRRPARAKRGGPARTQGNTRFSKERREEVAQYIAAHADEIGWEPTADQVASAWLEENFPPR